MRKVRYPNQAQWSLRHVSCVLPKGGKLAIVGPNGAGKTTFIKLLCRLYDPTEGDILLNGIDIRKYDYGEYLSLLSVVFQDFKLFSMKLGENVAAGVDYDPKRVWDCLEKAGMRERVEQMPDKLDTGLYQQKEDGVELSGGEGQKLALARALYKDAPVVILDEPTAALDPLSEYEIYSRFGGLVEGKTSVYISHRMSSCRFCDEIMVFDKGEIVQRGTHGALLERRSQEEVMARIPQFGTAEVGNFAPPPETVPPALGALMFNMERGVHLAEIGEFLRDCPEVRPFDLILANELDDGCARSGNKNTARELARAFGLNYAWGLEFIELGRTQHKREIRYREIAEQVPFKKKTAFFFTADSLAMEAIGFWAECGVRVPQDIGVAGFDNSVNAISYSIPRLTTINQDIAMKGCLAVRELVAVLQDPSHQSKNYKLPVSLVSRQSV